MTIDEAIRRLNFEASRHTHFLDTHDLQAIRLGIEALERIKEQRKLEACERRYLLPGETE